MLLRLRLRWLLLGRLRQAEGGLPWIRDLERTIRWSVLLRLGKRMAWLGGTLWVRWQTAGNLKRRGHLGWRGRLGRCLRLWLSVLLLRWLRR